MRIMTGAVSEHLTIDSMMIADSRAVSNIRQSLSETDPLSSPDRMTGTLKVLDSVVKFVKIIIIWS